MKIELIFPVLNESKTLEDQLNKVKHHISKIDAYDFLITIVDNGSTDETKTISKKLIKLKTVNKYLYLPEKGRGKAIKLAISKSNADIVIYMDIDLSTDLNSLLPLIESITKKNYDIAIGSRLSKGSNVIGRKKIREFTSRSYNLLIKFFFPFSRIDDMQCGFKAFSRLKILKALNLVTNNKWFFDTEIIIISRNLNLSIYQLPVKWTDDPNTSVNIISTAIEDIIGLIKLRIKLLKKII
jgi:glycosyltransferase involved in cell wall biosynthesis